ncbi:hypothetical protein AMTR_s00232p00018200 [Amborella trichopoda]|uniref:Uncharacterized protein n=1 Tax=Amborella trichopoda TaxID=13333 RepID=W1NVW3_AMBTC|nr:hypothetical protein AMTR_s00232p00018200 [Amborella trichopoda]
MSESESDFKDDHKIGEALIRVFEGLDIESGARPLTSIVPMKVKQDMMNHTDDYFIRPPLRAKFKKGHQKEDKPLPLKDRTCKLQWKLYSPQAHQIMRNMDYYSTTNQGLNNGK